ncbi:MAG: flagellar biosynthesis anti-sigma factor FlgM [Planctomycetota bacterium]
MQISGPGQVHGPHGLQGPHSLRGKSTPPANNTSQPATIDQLDISPEAARASEASEAGQVRADRVAEIRAQIADGTYETADKLDAALDRLLDEIG